MLGYKLFVYFTPCWFSLYFCESLLSTVKTKDVFTLLEGLHTKPYCNIQSFVLNTRSHMMYLGGHSLVFSPLGLAIARPRGLNTSSCPPKYIM